MNEIITYGQGYKLSSGVKVFVKSAKAICKNVTVISMGLTKELIDFLVDNDVTIISADDIASKYNIKLNISPYTLKVIFYYLYIKNYCTSSNVYMCDFTDTYFQSSPFNLIKNVNPYIATEKEYISNCETNTAWINICYNADIYNLLKKYEIINSGHIFGNRESCTSLLKEMCSDITQIISRVNNYPTIDQACLNKVVYFDQARYNILKNSNIVHLAHLGSSDVELNTTITINKRIPYVIHQYDVIKSLENHLYVKYQ